MTVEVGGECLREVEDQKLHPVFETEASVALALVKALGLAAVVLLYLKWLANEIEELLVALWGLEIPY